MRTRIVGWSHVNPRRFNVYWSGVCASPKMLGANIKPKINKTAITFSRFIIPRLKLALKGHFEAFKSSLSKSTSRFTQVLEKSILTRLFPIFWARKEESFTLNLNYIDLPLQSNAIASSQVAHVLNLIPDATCFSADFRKILAFHFLLFLKGLAQVFLFVKCHYKYGFLVLFLFLFRILSWLPRRFVSLVIFGCSLAGFFEEDRCWQFF